jgi:hypothetical protein
MEQVKSEIENMHSSTRRFREDPVFPGGPLTSQFLVRDEVYAEFCKTVTDALKDTG